MSHWVYNLLHFEHLLVELVYGELPRVIKGTYFREGSVAIGAVMEL